MGRKRRGRVRFIGIDRGGYGHFSVDGKHYREYRPRKAPWSFPTRHAAKPTAEKIQKRGFEARIIRTSSDPSIHGGRPYHIVIRPKKRKVKKRRG